MLLRFKEGIYLRKEYVRVKNLPYSFAHISDLHMSINQFNNPKFAAWIQKSVADFLFNSKIKILCVTGDLIDKAGDDFTLVIDWLFDLSVENIIVSFGNHDEPHIKEMFDYVQKKNEEYLTSKVFAGVNSFCTLNTIKYYMLPDIHSKYYNKHNIINLLEAKQDDCFKVLLSHNPMSFFDFNSLKVSKNKSLMISGHTHGGQIAFADILRSIFSRFISKGKICSTLRINHEHDCFKLQGSYSLDNLSLHINSGLGYHPPGRIFCPPTMTIYKPS